MAQKKGGMSADLKPGAKPPTEPPPKPLDLQGPFFHHCIDGELVPCAPRPLIEEVLRREGDAMGEPDGWAEEITEIIFKALDA